MSRTSMTIETALDEPSGVTELTHVFKELTNMVFEDRYHHYIHPRALRWVNGLTVTGLKDAEIHFLGPLVGFKQGDDQGIYADDAGVLNLVDCENVVVSGRIFNSRIKAEPGGTLAEQTGTAVNVVRSTAKFENCHVQSGCRLPFVVHSGSTVEVVDSVIEGSYFEFFNGASSLTVKNSAIRQDCPFPDSHSMLWVGSSHRPADPTATVLYENGFSIFENCRFEMATGRALVSGNGSYDTRSNVTFRGCVLADHDENFGIVSWHKNYNSIDVTTDFETTDDIVRVAPGSSGFGKFVDYYQDGGGKPGGPNGEAPIVVDGVSSADIPE